MSKSKKAPTADAALLEEDIKEMSASSTEELQAAVGRLGKLLGSAHWLSVGTYKERLLISHLARRIPRQFEISTGFVLSHHSGRKLLSRQLDVLIWDSANYPPLFRHGDFVVITPEACRVAVEVKGHLTHDELKDAIANLDSLAVFHEDVRAERHAIFTFLFAFDADKRLRFPNSYLNALYAHYSRSDIPLDQRLQRSGDENTWHTSWINGCAIVGTGAMAVSRLNLDKPPVAYMAYDTKKAGLDDTYGFLERAILRALLDLNRPFPFGRTGLRSTLLRSSSDLVPGKCVLLLPQSKDSTEFFAGKLPNHIGRLFRPHKPRGSAKTRWSARKSPGKRKAT